MGMKEDRQRGGGGPPSPEGSVRHSRRRRNLTRTLSSGPCVASPWRWPMGPGPGLEGRYLGYDGAIPTLIGPTQLIFRIDRRTSHIKYVIETRRLETDIFQTRYIDENGYVTTETFDRRLTLVAFFSNNILTLSYYIFTKSSPSFIHIPALGNIVLQII